MYSKMSSRIRKKRGQEKTEAEQKKMYTKKVEEKIFF